MPNWLKITLTVILAYFAVQIVFSILAVVLHLAFKIGIALLIGYVIYSIVNKKALGGGGRSLP